jgi:hypothetical protein
VRKPVDVGPRESRALSVEDALAHALDRASAARRWNVVAKLARELEARRLAAAGRTLRLCVSARDPNLAKVAA